MLFRGWGSVRDNDHDKLDSRVTSGAVRPECSILPFYHSLYPVSDTDMRVIRKQSEACQKDTKQVLYIPFNTDKGGVIWYPVVGSKQMWCGGGGAGSQLKRVEANTSYLLEFTPLRWRDDPSG